ncbi:MAG: DUF962 domain-containing protein [Pseudomonadota bacterium]
MNDATPQRFEHFRDFYPYYLAEHADPRCRVMHFIGSTGVIAVVIAAIVTANAWWLLAMPLVGYGFAWLGHFVFEKNKPATFQYPLYSLAGDWVMYADILRGRISLVR